MQEGNGDNAEASSTYCGHILDDSAGESGGSHVRIPIPCVHGVLVRARFVPGPGGSHREGTCRPEVLRGVPVGVARGEPASPSGGTC